MALVTVNNTQGQSIQSFAQRLETDWHLSGGSQQRSVLLLVSVGDRKWSILPTQSLLPLLGPQRLAEIGQAMHMYLRVDQDDDAFTLGAQDVAQLLAQGSGVALAAPFFPLPPPGGLPDMLGIKSALWVASVLALVLLLGWRTRVIRLPRRRSS